mmetsp:Transcript_28384/g.57229  ORF Transcript_28384/g.57229 Transcript_28384/m.57229 type:complete len:253 (-) Transcript_28384:55-813(-)
MMDYHLCMWPEPLCQGDDSIARLFDQMNDKDSEGGIEHGQAMLRERVDTLRAAHPTAPLISFSHFLPRIELNPEKRYLFYPPLSKACGSNYLRARVDALKPSVHIFGHTHFGWDATHDGVRYIQAPLSYPEERAGRLGTVATGEFPQTSPPAPLLVYDARDRTYPPTYDAGWSNFYARYPRLPHMSHIIAPYVASNFKQVPGVGRIGWLAPDDNPTSAASGDPIPAWALGPKSAVVHEVNQRANGRNMAKNR